MTLIEKYKDEAISDDQILKNLTFIINATKNGLDLFTTDSTDETNQITYCVPCGEDVETYGKIPGICYSESIARNAIIEMFNSYGMLLLSWLKNEQEEIDLCVKLKFTPVAITVDENGVQKEIFDAIFKFSKCNNKIGFCVRRVIPLLGKKERN